MEKSIIVTVYVDGVPLNQLESIQEALDSLFEEYDDKRITVQIQDTRLVRPGP